MNVTTHDLQTQVKFLKGRGQVSVIRKALANRPHRHPTITDALVIAIMSRETNCQNVVGDGGHGRGILQIDDRYHADWLGKHKGCKSGSFTVAKGHDALDSGYVPTTTAAIDFLCDYLTASIEYAKRNGVANGSRLKFAVSSYNAGQGGAMKGYRQGDSDKYTAHGDYARDVLQRRDALKKILG